MHESVDGMYYEPLSREPFKIVPIAVSHHGLPKYVIVRHDKGPKGDR